MHFQPIMHPFDFWTQRMIRRERERERDRDRERERERVTGRVKTNTKLSFHKSRCFPPPISYIFDIFKYLMTTFQIKISIVFTTRTIIPTRFLMLPRKACTNTNSKSNVTSFHQKCIVRITYQVCLLRGRFRMTLPRRTYYLLPAWDLSLTTYV